MRLRLGLLASLSVGALLTGLTATVFAADGSAPSGPAVSGVNGKLGAFGGGNDDNEALGAFLAVAFPLSDLIGAQVDGMGGESGGNAFWGVGGHVFMRDPSKGLVGVYVSYTRWDTDTTSVSDPVGGIADVSGEVGKAGLEGELYLDRVSLEGFAGYQFGAEEGLAAKATAAFYPTDNLRLDVNVRHLEGPGVIGYAGAEWQPTLRPFSVFADAGLTEDEDWFAHGGVKVYFGGAEKTLIRRHREDDPEIDLPLDLFASVGDGFCPEGTELNDGSTCEAP